MEAENCLLPKLAVKNNMSGQNPKEHGEIRLANFGRRFSYDIKKEMSSMPDANTSQGSLTRLLPKIDKPNGTMVLPAPTKGVPQSIALGLLSCLLLFFSGCAKDETNARNLSAIPCSLRVNTTTIGGGIIIGYFTANNRIALLTARHVVTANHEWLDKIHVVLPGNEPFLLKQTADRWLTSEDESVDSAWLMLDKEERSHCINTDIAIKDVNVSSKIPEYATVQIANAFAIHTCRYVDRCFIRDMPFEDNRVLKKVRLHIGVLDKVTEKSESGSPVFWTDADGQVFLVGTTSIANRECNITGYIDIDQMGSLVLASLDGKASVRLIDCPDFW
ncbi:MAG: hypothetical protein II823_05245 [Kiritimatiellae bacterium]|nr:hypothetical protein [Kiritimatiellia bacterium]